MTKKLLVLIFVFSISLQVASADIIHFERGGASSSAGIVKVGRLNYEGALVSYADEFDGGDASVALGGSLLRYGLHKRFELRVTNSGLILTDSLAGFDNLGLGFKAALLNEEHGLIPVVNLTTDFQIPIGREEFRNPGFNHFYQLTLAHGLTNRLSYIIQLGTLFSSIETGNRKFDAFEFPYIFNLSYAVNDRLGLFTDIYGSWGFTDGTSSPLSQDFGFAYALTDNWIFDFSLNWGLNESAPDFGIDFGTAFRIF